MIYNDSHFDKKIKKNKKMKLLTLESLFVFAQSHLIRHLCMPQSS